MLRQGDPAHVVDPAQIEDCYISAAELARLTGVHQEVLLRSELVLLEGLRFDFIVFSPYRAIEGFLEVGWSKVAACCCRLVCRRPAPERHQVVTSKRDSLAVSPMCNSCVGNNGALAMRLVSMPERPYISIPKRLPGPCLPAGHRGMPKERQRRHRSRRQQPRVGRVQHRPRQHR
jgi:hypothetical protein